MSKSASRAGQRTAGRLWFIEKCETRPEKNLFGDRIIITEQDASRNANRFCDQSPRQLVPVVSSPRKTRPTKSVVATLQKDSCGRTVSVVFVHQERQSKYKLWEQKSENNSAVVFEEPGQELHARTVELSVAIISSRVKRQSGAGSIRTLRRELYGETHIKDKSSRRVISHRQLAEYAIE